MGPYFAPAAFPDLHSRPQHGPSHQPACRLRRAFARTDGDPDLPADRGAKTSSWSLPAVSRRPAHQSGPCRTDIADHRGTPRIMMFRGTEEGSMFVHESCRRARLPRLAGHWHDIDVQSRGHALGPHSQRTDVGRPQGGQSGRHGRGGKASGAPRSVHRAGRPRLLRPTTAVRASQARMAHEHHPTGLLTQKRGGSVPTAPRRTGPLERAEELGTLLLLAVERAKDHDSPYAPDANWTTGIIPRA